MKMIRTPSTRTLLRGLVLAVTALSSYVATAHPYATCLTNGAGVISFRLNESADTVKVVQGATTVNLGALGQGLYGPTDLTGSGIAAGQFKVVVDKVGSGSPSFITPSAANTNNTMFYSPRAVGVNKRPASPYFGRIYVGDNPGTTGAGRTTGDGVYVLNADYSDALGQGNTALTGGLNMTTGGTSMPWRFRVGQDDDMLYICDYSDSTGNLYRTDPDVSAGSGTNVFMAPIGTMASPLDPAMNHGSMEEVYVTGSQATSDLTVYTVDEDYETTPGGLTELNSLWKYNIGGAAFPWSTMPDAKIMTPSIGFVGQVMGLDRGTNGYWYLLDNRSSGGQTCLQVIDPAGPTVVWNSYDASFGLGLPRDWCSNSVSVAVSPDMKFCAVQRSSGIIMLMRMNAGIPDLAGRIEFTGAGNGRQIVFDAADNLYLVSNTTERLRIYSLGLTTTATTTSGAGGTGTSDFTLETPATDVSVTVTPADINEQGATSATFTLTRNNAPSLASPLAVTFTMSGTATRTSDYVLQTNSVTFTGNVVYIPAGQSSVDVTITAVDDAVAELTETAILSVNASANYTAGSPPSAQVNIFDNEKPALNIAVVYSSMYERLPNDYVRYRLTRLGDINASSFGANVSWSGTAALSRYTQPGNPVATFNPGDVTLDFDATAPVNDSVLQGNQTIICSVAAATSSEYNIGATNSATANIVDDEVPAETTLLYSENFNTDVPANWAVKFGSGNGVDDYRIGQIGTPVFSYDYAGGTYIPALPAAPHSTSDTLGLYMTVNKDESTTLGGAGLNVYPVGKSFSGNYAVRFDMYLMVGNAASTTEYALFGIACSGSKTNWFRNSTGGVPGGGSYDGLWFGVEADGAALGDYVIYSGPTTTGNNPTALTPGVNASSLTGIFKNPPYGGNILPGAPGCTETSSTPCWSDVEISKIGRYIRLKINNTFIMSYTNATAATNGNIMLGYCDAYDSVMAGNSCVVYDNLRVVPLGINITGISQVGANNEITFTFGVDEATTAFKLQNSTTVNGTYADAGTATITKLSPGVYKATIAAAAPNFYRIRYAVP